MEEEKTLIDRKLIEIRNEVNLWLNPSYYSNKDQSIKIDTLNNTIGDASYRFGKALRTLPKMPYLVEQLDELILGLDKKYNSYKSLNIGSQFTAAMISGWNVIKVTLSSFQSELSTYLYNESLNTDVSYEDVVLSRDQVALLILYLRQTKMITNNISDIKAASAFHDLTGFSSIQLSHKISGSAKYERNLITDIESNYNKLQDLLRTIIKLIDDDKRKSILKKDK